MSLANSIPPRSITFMFLCRRQREQLPMLMLLTRTRFLLGLHRWGTRDISAAPL